LTKIRRKSRPKKRQELSLKELQTIVDRAREAPLTDEDHQKLKAAVDTLGTLTLELEAKGASVKRLRNIIFGASTEKTSQVVGERSSKGTEPGALKKSPVETKKRKGHGRNPADAYKGADKVKVSHKSLGHGDHCCECDKGKVYRQPKPSVLVRVTGLAPLAATVYEKERLRCGLCGKVFTAQSPDGVGDKKYDESVGSMIGIFKYGCGLPFNRLEKLQGNMGIPLPAATQWDLVQQSSVPLLPVYLEVIRQAAQGTILHNDDTTIKILEIEREIRQESAQEPGGRTGMFTTGIVAIESGYKIALFFTGREHAGENLEKVLAQRAEELQPPIQMCDALSRNTSGEFETIVANCVTHARRKFVEVADSFPVECEHVLNELAKVYKNDAVAKKREMSPEDRLSFHKKNSGPVMKELKQWMAAQIGEKLIEPNSGLGEAIGYSVKHWDKLTLFLRVAGAPLDNNICERVLKKAILHRKNALFFKTQNGARVGDLFMSLIHTCELNDVSPFDYLTQVQRHADTAEANPADWMPWNYKDALERQAEDSAPAG